jgi:hypothetical protein
MDGDSFWRFILLVPGEVPFRGLALIRSDLMDCGINSNQYQSTKPYSGNSSRDTTLVLDLIRNGQAQQEHDESHFQASHSQPVECHGT